LKQSTCLLKPSPRSVIAECQVDIKIFPDQVDAEKVPDQVDAEKVPDQVDAEKVPDQVDAEKSWMQKSPRSSGCRQIIWVHPIPDQPQGKNLMIVGNQVAKSSENSYPTQY